jgi:two-component system, LuxR family, response regulator FixJ
MLASSMIYILDDDAGVRDSLHALLESENLMTREFASSEEFLAAQRPDLGDCLIIDIHMPGISGLDVLDELRRRGNAIPAIVVTGRPSAALASRAAAAGALAVIAKPYRAEEILGLIRASLRQAAVRS